jgi:single-stranded-DNA-specific exonuclease
MKYELIKPINYSYNAKQQILFNRGIKEKDFNHYMNLTDDDINEPECFGEDLLLAAATQLKEVMDKKEDICVVVDCDCDGYTSSAVLINYLYDLDPAYTETHVHYYMHESKQHGLADAMDWIEAIGPDLVIIPDAGSNDVDQLYKLEDTGTSIIILDHHEIEEQGFWLTEKHPHAFLINSQSQQYPNKELSGVGVVWQFCRYLDKINKTNFAEYYLDLVALGNTGDMMSLRSFETRRLISKGLEPERIHNPFMYEMWQKSKFKLGDNPTSWGVTFYIVPLVNAITRSGTLDEKELIFESMLKFKAFNEIPSNKRGHKLGEKERLVDQAVRTATNVKNRQTREEEKGLELVTHLIEDNHMMDHKVLLFLLEPGQIKPEIRGLIANKLMARYQRPCCMLTKGTDKEGNITYQGSARGCDKVGVTEFKDICAATQVCDYTVGHQGAFGLGLREENIQKFINNTDFQLANMSSEPIYYVDYIWRVNEVDPTAILDIADMAEYYGKDFDESLVAIKGLQITKEMLTMMASNTVKITLPNGVSMIKFRMPDEEYNKLYSECGFVEIDVIGKCNCNNWGGNKYAQIMIEDYEIVGGCAYIF